MRNCLAKIFPLFFLVMVLSFFPGCGDGKKPAGNGEALVPGVASVDQGVILNLPAFQEANEEFAKQRKEKAEEYSKALEEEGLNDKAKELIYREFENELAEIRYGLITPLLDKEKDLIEEVAKRDGYSVVLDETLVVYGVEDITGKISKGFEKDENKEGETGENGETEEKPEPAQTEKKDTSPVEQLVGYISKSKLAELPELRKVEDKLKEEYRKIERKIQEETKDLEDQAKITEVVSKYEKEFEAKREELYKPVEDKINSAAEEIAKAKGLIVIVDEEDILYGGEDITYDVVDKLKNS